MNVRDDPVPSSSDLEVWREAFAKNRLRDYKLEVLVAALQDLGPKTDRRVREALASRISDALMWMLRKRVGFNHPNEGRDIIERVHADLIAALFNPASADGKALRVAFSARVTFRIKDAIATEFRHSRIPTEEKAWTVGEADAEPESPAGDGPLEVGQVQPPSEPDAGSGHADHDLGGSKASIRADCRTGQADDSNGDDLDFQAGTIRETDVFDGVKVLEETIDNARILSSVTDERKRLAFYLHMDRIPIHSIKGPSIARALGVDRKTIGDWIAEVQEQLSRHSDVTLLESASSGARK
ncbi:hypothetical protein [Pararhizobium sp. PWRC1-1]|uniref:hypothetical protein n=1 Tax=Pararhizobium sp. PWRC1-1 TaxID=2804566 RepID=UPI003CE90FEC